MDLTPEARGEIVEEAKRRALKEMGKPESELASEEKRQAGSLANDYAVQMLKEAHDFKLRLADLDADKYAFEKVFAEDLQNTPYAQNLNDDANLEEDFSSQVDENARYNRNDTVWNDTPFDEQVIADVEKEFEDRDSSSNNSLQKYINSNLDSYVFNEDSGVYESKFGYDVYKNENTGNYEVYGGEDYPIDYFSNLKDAEDFALDLYFKENKTNDFSKTDKDINLEKFESALNKLGIKIDKIKDAGTGTQYAYVGNLKIRFADHQQLYNADMSVDPDGNSWQDAVKYVLNKRIEEISDNLKSAIENKEDLKNALNLKGVGTIDFLWGKKGKFNKTKNRYYDGFGISHIIAQRDLQGINGKEFALKIPEILLKGKIEKVSGNDDNKRLNFRYKDGVVVLKKENGNNHWIITAFIKEDGGRSVIDHSAYALQNPEISSVKGASNFTQSENFSENQEENAKYSKNFDENAENADLGGDLPQGKGEPLVFKPILKPKLPLPKRFREGKVAGIGDIRRWVSEAMGINVNLEADAGADYNGVYTTPSDSIHLRSDNINSLRVLFHELGHSIEKRFFNDYFSDNPNSEAGRELFDYFKKQANAKAYKKSDYVGESFAEFIKEFVLNPGSAAKEFPKTAKLFSIALENHAGLNEILDKTRQMVDRYQNASLKEKAQARIQSSDKEKTKVFLRERPLKIYNWLTRHFTDKSARLADLQRIVNKLAGEGTADFDTLRRAIVQGGGNGQTEFSLTQKQLDLKGRIVGKSYADILNPVESRLDDFRLFVVSRRMVNLMQKNGYLKDGKYRAGANDFCVEKSGFTVNGILEFSTFSVGFFNSSYLTISKRFAIFQEIWI